MMCYRFVWYDMRFVWHAMWFWNWRLDDLICFANVNIYFFKIKILKPELKKKCFMLWYAMLCYYEWESYDILFFFHAMVLNFNAMVRDFNDMLCYSVYICWMNCMYYTSITWYKKTVYNKEFYTAVKFLKNR